MNRKKIGMVAVGTLCASAAFGDLADYVDPFVGTSATGHTFPGACVPFGMVQASPDGGTESWHYCSGYRYEDREIKGFSQTHLNGTGGCELGDVRILPLGYGGRGATRPTDFSARIDKSSERAKPGYYAVTLSDPAVRVEVTASERAAIYRFIFEKGAGAHLLLDTQWGIVNGGNLAKYVLESSLTVEGRTRAVGWKRTHNWNLRETGFVVEFDHPLKTYRKLLKSDAKEKGERYVFDFDLKDGEALMVKVGLAAAGGGPGVSALPERAKRNLEAEISGWDFDAVKNAARQKWNFGLNSPSPVHRSVAICIGGSAQKAMIEVRQRRSNVQCFPIMRRMPLSGFRDFGRISTVPKFMDMSGKIGVMV